MDVFLVVALGLPPPGRTGLIPGEYAYMDRLEAHLESAPIPGWQQRYGDVRASYV